MKNESWSAAKESLATGLVSNLTRDCWSDIFLNNNSNIESMSIVNGEYVKIYIANVFS